MDKMISICGLDCSTCAALIAHQTGDQALREKTAKEWSAAYGAEIKSEMIDCVGCAETQGVHIGHCAECAMRTCGLAKAVANCGVCPEFESCSTIGEFIAKVPAAKANLEEYRAARKG
ncbi:MAG: DUF3795 domain-containing protein [Acidobacteriota bacterium]|nr:DUF3795 domain-containing protein [Acidobacteriota bacterium]